MSTDTAAIHHVTSIASDPQRNVECYTGGSGFTHDESADELGSSPTLPPWLEEDRETIGGQLSPLGADPLEAN
jgi:catechol 2,3-dioxygenase-like lactoylglutathione lyase family enzyme